MPSLVHHFRHRFYTSRWSKRKKVIRRVKNKTINKRISVSVLYTDPVLAKYKKKKCKIKKNKIPVVKKINFPCQEKTCHWAFNYILYRTLIVSSTKYNWKSSGRIPLGSTHIRLCMSLKVNQITLVRLITINRIKF